MRALARLPVVVRLTIGAWLVTKGIICPAQTVLVSSDANWAYFHEGIAPPPGWNQPGLNPEWPMGPAKFGFGGDGEITLLPDNGSLTTYFRHAFFVETPSGITNLLGRIVADDGAVVYLNGQEVARINMYPGPVGSNTFGATDLGRPQETNWVNFIPRPATLSPGLNLLAVEVHQSGRESRDLGFALEWLANVPGLNPTLTIIEPLASGRFEAGTNLPVRASVYDPGNQVSNLVFSVDGETRFTATPNRPQFILADVVAGDHSLSVRTILLDGTTIASAPVSIHVDPPRGFSVIVPNGAVWRYLDNGPDPSPSWMELGFDDAAWGAGPAELGFGDGNIDRRPERTEIGFGGNPFSRRITTYFRHQFAVTDPAQFSNLVLRLMRDDGAVVYLNGLEIARHNLPLGPITPGLMGDVAQDDGALFHEIPLSQTVSLRAGPNVLAVEVHQNSPESSDLSFDLMLLARSAPPAFLVQPESVILPYSINVTLHAEATGEPQYQWFRNDVPVPGAITSALTLTSVERDAAGLYHAVASNSSGSTASAVAEVQVCLTKRGGPVSGVIASTNLPGLVALEDSLTASAGRQDGPEALGATTGSSPTVHFSAGVPLYFVTEKGTPDPLISFNCGAPSTHTKWVGYYSAFPQRLRISTEGSDINTVLGVYTNTGGRSPKLVEVACNRGHASEPAGVVEFEAQHRVYYIAADGENGETGVVRLKIGGGLLQAPFYNSATDTFEFEVIVRSNVTAAVRSTGVADLPAFTNFADWTFFGQFMTNRDWVFPQSVPDASTLPRRYFGGREH